MEAGRASSELESITALRAKFSRVYEMLDASIELSELPSDPEEVFEYLFSKIESWKSLIAGLRSLITAYVFKFVEENPLEQRVTVPDCPICLEPVFPLCSFTTECSHTFHGHCFMELYKGTIEEDAKAACPLCRQDLLFYNCFESLTDPMAKPVPSRMRGFQSRVEGWGMRRGLDYVIQTAMMFSYKLMQGWWDCQRTLRDERAASGRSEDLVIVAEETELMEFRDTRRLEQAAKFRLDSAVEKFNTIYQQKE